MNIQIESTLIILAITAAVFDIFLFLYKYLSIRKDMLRKNLPFGFIRMINNSLQQTIFSYLDSLTLEKVESTPLKIVSSPLRNYSNDEKEENTLYEYDGEILCDFYECCCKGCPYESNIKQIELCGSLNRCFVRTKNKFIRKLKYVMFFIVQPYFYLLLNNFLTFTTNRIIIIIFSIILQCYQFFVLLFVFSLISTKREMVRLDKNKEDQRGLLLYYHIRKSFIFVIFLMIMFILSSVMQSSLELEYINDQISDYCRFNITYLFIGNVVLLLYMRYNHCLTNDLIQDNDNILKTQQRLYVMQNNLMKFFPSEEQFQLQLQETNCDDLKIANILKDQCHEAKLNLTLSLQAIEKQQFKKIKKNLGQSIWAIRSLIIYLYLNTYITILSITWIYVEIAKDSKNQVSEWLIYLLITMNFLQYTAFPILLPFLFDKKDLFGQDYGEWKQNQWQQIEIINN